MNQEQHSRIQGLTDSDIAESKKKFGVNKETSHDFTTLTLIGKTVFSVFNIVMLVLIVVLYAINEKSNANFLGIVAGINTLIELVQEIRARLVVKRLNKLTQKTATVIRNGQEQEIPLDELVINDVIHVKSGDKVAVDGEVIDVEYAEFDESILTGESKYIEKKKGETIHAGSFIAAGSCYYKMIKFARESYIQTITGQIAKQAIVESPLQSQINQIIKALTYMTIFFIILIVIEGLVQSNQKEEIIINSATLISTLVPQGLVLITTISFAYGASKIAKYQAVVQKLSAIEAMANTKVVCMDKTGTLTENKFEVKLMKTY